MSVVRSLLVLGSFSRSAYDGVCLVSEVGSYLAMRSHHFARRMDSLPVAGRVGGDLGRFFAIVTSPLQILANLLTARARCVEVFLRITLDLWRPAPANRDLIPEF